MIVLTSWFWIFVQDSVLECLRHDGSSPPRTWLQSQGPRCRWCYVDVPHSEPELVIDLHPWTCYENIVGINKKGFFFFQSTTARTNEMLNNHVLKTVLLTFNEHWNEEVAVSLPSVTILESTVVWAHHHQSVIPLPRCLYCIKQLTNLNMTLWQNSSLWI